LKSYFLKQHNVIDLNCSYLTHTNTCYVLPDILPVLHCCVLPYLILLYTKTAKPKSMLKPLVSMFSYLENDFISLITYNQDMVFNSQRIPVISALQ